MSARRRTLLGAGAAALVLPLGACSLFDEDLKPITPGRREDVLPQSFELVPDPALADRPVTVPPPEGNADWPQPGRNGTHLAGDPAWSGGDKIAWQVKIGAGQDYRSQLSASPLVAGGRVYTMDADAAIDCFDLRTGHLLWHVATRPKKQASTNVGGGITSDGDTIYAATGLARAFAIDARTGHVRWQVPTQVPVRSPPTIHHGRLFFGTIDERLLALDAHDGHQLWTYQASSSFNAVLGQPAPAAANHVVVAGFGSGELATLGTSDGSLLWTDALGGSVGASPLEFASIRGEPVIDGETVYAISVGGLMTATDLRTGRRVWERPVGGGLTPAVLPDWIFLLTADQTVVCIEKTAGHVRWTSVLPRYAKPNSHKQPILWAGPVLAGGHLVLVSSTGQLAILDPADGGIEDQRKLRGPASLTPIVADNALLVLTNDGRRTAYR